MGKNDFSNTFVDSVMKSNLTNNKDWPNVISYTALCHNIVIVGRFTRNSISWCLHWEDFYCVSRNLLPTLSLIYAVSVIRFACTCMAVVKGKYQYLL